MKGGTKVQRTIRKKERHTSTSREVGECISIEGMQRQATNEGECQNERPKNKAMQKDTTTRCTP
jgi:hypothetical protein